MRKVLLGVLSIVGIAQAASYESIARPDSLRCSTCKTVVQAANDHIKDEGVLKAIDMFFQALNAQSQTPYTFADSLSQLILTPDYFCGKIVKLCENGPEYKEIDSTDAIRKILKNKQPHMQNNDYIDTIYKQIGEDPKPRKTLKFVQIADPHVDFWYQEDVFADCGYGYCCRQQTQTGKGSILTGKFGTLNVGCDPPRATFEEALKFIKEEIKPDVLLWTGDNSPHDGPMSSEERITYTLNQTSQMIDNAFSPDNVEIFATYGNHDAFPANQWNFKTGNKAIQDGIDTYFKWMNKDQRERFFKTGYYSQNVEAIKDREVRVISINTGSCDIINKYLFSVLSDPNDQLQFLVSELEHLEKVNGYAILIQHINPSQCSIPYAIRYQAILDRYQHVIRMNIFGHLHSDRIELSKAYDGQQSAIGVMHFCGGMTTWSQGSPSVCVYEVDEETMLPVNRYTYSFDMQKANKEGKISWNLRTNWIKDLKMKDLSPSSVSEFALRLTQDKKLVQDYNKRQYRYYEGTFQLSECDLYCQRDIYCFIVTQNLQEQSHCLGKETVFDLKNDFLNSLIQIIQDPWVEIIKPKKMIKKNKGNFFGLEGN
ncbi:ser thr protein phosphatase family protein [Stylonychia lemnae]|uniref:Ser thr protein phosphatase family protein n=1 Tax=Stylonychia lemnae TaxID=5949 RepID=A0A078B331_STYLE|nr:ser thr protein phosphatase family protein [Stylonychia lemnae]|eukprot:CDW88676.1 ser thr protein phosphatase family protein [Stylonychia lemnae]